MLSIFFIGIALSMDAFSIALSMGTNNLSKKSIGLTITLVGLMHFIMPQLGLMLGNQVYNFININPKFIISVILYYLIIVMYFDKSSKNVNIESFINIFLFAFSVSIDSFSVGIGLKGLTEHYILASIVFSLCAFCITYIGLVLGKYSLKILKNKTKYVGMILLFITATVNLCQLFID